MDYRQTLLWTITDRLFAITSSLIYRPAMDRNLSLGNRIISRKIQNKERRRHLIRLHQIKHNSALSPYNQLNVNVQSSQTLKEKGAASSFFRNAIPAADYSDKNLQIERKNVAIFNRIANIINERPRMVFPKSRSFVKSIDEALSLHEKRQEQLKSQNQQMEKRIKQQHSTIKNTRIFKDRVQNEKYMRLITKYPLQIGRRLQSEHARQHSLDSLLAYQTFPPGSELFAQKSLDFQMRIHFMSSGNGYSFRVADLLDGKHYQLQMDALEFRKEYLENEMSFANMMARLRMNRHGEMKYQSIARGPKTDKLEQSALISSKN